MRFALALLLPLTGCFFYAKDTRTTRVVSDDLQPVPLQRSASSPGGPTIEARTFDAIVRAYVSTPRMCRRDRVIGLEVTHGKKWSFTVIDDRSGYGLLLGIVLAPFTLPVSALITGLVVSNHDDTITHEIKVTQEGVQPCPEASRRPLQFTWPSGRTQATTSKADGTAELEVPADEPESGAISIATPGGTPITVGYFKSYEVCEIVRAAAFDQALGNLALVPRIPRCDVMTTRSVPAREQGWALAIAALTAATRNDCKVVFESEEGVRNLMPQRHDAIYGHPLVAACFQREATRRQQMTECMVRRADAMRAALQIKNLNERGRALGRVPQCQ